MNKPYVQAQGKELQTFARENKGQPPAQSVTEFVNSNRGPVDPEARMRRVIALQDEALQLLQDGRDGVRRTPDARSRRPNFARSHPAPVAPCNSGAGQESGPTWRMPTTTDADTWHTSARPSLQVRAPSAEEHETVRERQWQNMERDHRNSNQFVKEDYLQSSVRYGAAVNSIDMVNSQPPGTGRTWARHNPRAAARLRSRNTPLRRHRSYSTRNSHAKPPRTFVKGDFVKIVKEGRYFGDQGKIGKVLEVSDDGTIKRYKILLKSGDVQWYKSQCVEAYSFSQLDC